VFRVGHVLYAGFFYFNKKRLFEKAQQAVQLGRAFRCDNMTADIIIYHRNATRGAPNLLFSRFQQQPPPVLQSPCRVHRYE
jgi:hypothetical protein